MLVEGAEYRAVTVIMGALGVAGGTGGQPGQDGVSSCCHPSSGTEDLPPGHEAVGA